MLLNLLQLEVRSQIIYVYVKLLKGTEATPLIYPVCGTLKPNYQNK